MAENAAESIGKRTSGRYAFRDSFALLDPDIVDLYFDDDASNDTSHSIFDSSITEEDLADLKAAGEADLDEPGFETTSSASTSTPPAAVGSGSSNQLGVASKASNTSLNYDPLLNPPPSATQESPRGAFAPPRLPDPSRADLGELGGDDSGESTRDVAREMQDASNAFIRPRRRTHYASMISADDLKQLSTQIDHVEAEKQQIRDSQARARNEVAGRLELQFSQGKPTSPLAGSPSSQPAAPVAVTPKSGGRERPQSMMVSLPSSSSSPKAQSGSPSQNNQQAQSNGEVGWFSRVFGGLKNSSSGNSTSTTATRSTSPSSSSDVPLQKLQKAPPPSSQINTISPSQPTKPLTPQQIAALEREHKRAEQYLEYLRMANTMDFSALKAHRIIYESGVDFHGRPVVTLIGNIPKDVNWDHLFLFFLSTLDPLVEKEYVLVYVHLTESTRPSLAWMRKVYTLFQRKWKKNLKQLFIVYPTFWVKTIFRVFRPFVSSKFWSKLVYVDDPKKLYGYMNPTAVQLPEYAMTEALKAEMKRYFGVPLDRLMLHEINKGRNMPQIVESAIAAIEARGLEQEGIFRLSGTLSRIKELRAQYDSGIAVDLEKEPELHVVSGLLKMWLRELPDPLVPYPNPNPETLFQKKLAFSLTKNFSNVFNSYFLYDMFIDNYDKNDHVASKKRVGDLMISIPLFNLQILDKLFGLLRKIAARSSVNKMTSTNLAIVFGPNLLRPEQEQPEFALLHASIIPAIVKFLIESPEELLAPAIALRMEAQRQLEDAKKASELAQKPQAPPQAASSSAAAAPAATAEPREDESYSGGSLLSMGPRQFGYVRDRSRMTQNRRAAGQSMRTEPLTPEKLEEMAKAEEAMNPSKDSYRFSTGFGPLNPSRVQANAPATSAPPSGDLMQFGDEQPPSGSDESSSSMSN